MTMSEFKIEKAQRKGSFVFMQLAGLSGCGKTYSALRLARGLVGANGKIGVIDTEQKRASLYADSFGGFDVINLEPPFTPEKYMKARYAFKKAGFHSVVVDSMSHEWEGEGGILEIADGMKNKYGKPMQGLAKWNEPKARHKKFMNHMLHCGMHIVGCYRAKKPMQEIMVDGKKTMQEGDLIICSEHKNIYDITVSLILDEDTRMPLVNGKCPEGIEYLFRPDRLITEKAGEGVIDWLNNRQKDKDSLIHEGRSQPDQNKWYETLSNSEKYLARKYKKDMAVEVKPVEKPVEVSEDDSEDLLNDILNEE